MKTGRSLLTLFVGGKRNLLKVHQNYADQSVGPQKNVSKIKEVIDKDARYMVGDLERMVGSLSKEQLILQKTLNVREMSARKKKQQAE